jgi:predicted DNA-binding mobile mystery protein A
MSKFKNLQIQNLDKKFKSYSTIPVPKEGWIKTIRTSLFMSLAFLAKKMGVTPQAIASFEQSEIDENISLKTLRNVASAMNCQLHYVLIPADKSLNKILLKQAEIKSKNIVDEVDKSMALEDQKVKNKTASIKSLVKDLIANPNSKLWE